MSIHKDAHDCRLTLEFILGGLSALKRDLEGLILGQNMFKILLDRGEAS